MPVPKVLAKPSTMHVPTVHAPTMHALALTEHVPTVQAPTMHAPTVHAPTVHHVQHPLAAPITKPDLVKAPAPTRLS